MSPFGVSVRLVARALVVCVTAVTAAFLTVGFVGVERYGRNYWLYRGFPPPTDPGYVTQQGLEQHISVTSPALGGRTQQVYVYLPPGYDRHPDKRYPVVYLLHGFPGRPLAFLLTVRLGVVESWSGYERAAHIRSIFGRELQSVTANSPLDTLPAAAPELRRAHVYFWFYSGTDDPLGVQNRAFADELTRLQVPHRYLVFRGGHNWALWRGQATRELLAVEKTLAHG